MSLRFNDRENQPESTKLRRPPNYFARRVQLRIMTLLGSLMLVFILMHEAAKPRNWEWMWGADGASGLVVEPVEPVRRHVDTRLRQPPGRSSSDGPVVRQEDRHASPTRPEQVVPDDDSPFYRATFDVWARVWNQLDIDRKSLMQTGLRVARRGEPLPEEERSAWSDLVEFLDSRWDAYLNDEVLALGQDPGEISDDVKRRRLDLIDRMRRRWADETRPALEAIGRGEVLGEDPKRAADRLREMLDQILLNLVRDNTVWRVAERDAWFRLCERLMEGDPDGDADSVGLTSYLQLYDQSRYYRGRPVKVRGEIRLAYFQPSRDNALGVEGYYIFWIKPTGGPDAPMVVYSLDLPEGFPTIEKQRRDLQGLGQVEFVGYFFKRLAYRAKDGINTAPLVAARIAEWDSSAGGSSGAALPGSLTIGISIALTAALAVAIASLVYRQSRVLGPVRARRAARQDWERRRIAELSDREVKPGVHDSLGELADSEVHEG